MPPPARTGPRTADSTSSHRGVDQLYVGRRNEREAERTLQTSKDRLEGRAGA